MYERGGEIVLEIVFWGVGLSGKTTNLQHVFAHTPPERRSAMESIADARGRLLSFSMRPESLAPLRGRPVRLALRTIPGAVVYDASRETILRGADAVVHVVDTQAARLAQAIESARELAETSQRTTGRALGEVPLVRQYNKRDLPSALPRAALDAAFGAPARTVEAIATQGVGVLDTLRECARLALEAEAARTR